MMHCRSERGMVLLFTLFACLTVAVVVQTLCVAVLIAERAAADEVAGRTRLQEKDDALAGLRQRALTVWQPGSFPDLLDGGRVADGVLSDIPTGGGWLMGAKATQPSSLSVQSVSALLEYARDGLDLPDAAVVARAVTMAPERQEPWLTHTAGDDAGLVALGGGWCLDDGWWALFAEMADTAVGQTLAGDLAPTAGVTVVQAPQGRRVGVPAGTVGRSASEPILLVVTGGADLDATGLTDLYGVVVVDEGSVSLDGTTLHGAVFAGDTVSLGATGRIVYCRSLYRWATDRSLVRARLVPGSRWEGTD